MSSIWGSVYCYSTRDSSIWVTQTAALGDCSPTAEEGVFASICVSNLILYINESVSVHTGKILCFLFTLINACHSFLCVAMWCNLFLLVARRVLIMRNMWCHVEASRNFLCLRRRALSCSHRHSVASAHLEWMQCTLHSIYYILCANQLWYQMCFSCYFPHNRWEQSYS